MSLHSKASVFLAGLKPRFTISVVPTALGSMIYDHRFETLEPFIFSFAFAFASAFFGGVETPLYNIGRAYGTLIDDL